MIYFNEIYNKLKRTKVTIKEAKPIVTFDDFKDTTKANFQSIIKSSNKDDVLSKWEKLKTNYNNNLISKSTKSVSEYITDKEKGVVYRFSNHWGIMINTCSWFLDKEVFSDWAIARANLKDFERKSGGIANQWNPKKY